MGIQAAPPTHLDESNSRQAKAKLGTSEDGMPLRIENSVIFNRPLVPTWLRHK